MSDRPLGLRSSSASADRLVPTPLELHAGLISGPARSAVRMTSPLDQAGPRAVLEDVIAQHLRAGPCGVEFSGGRDSSLVLAIAVEVARREGLPLPTALILRHPGVVGADESSWQDLVLNHLGAPREVVIVPPSVSDVAGPLAVSQLERHGPMFPAPSAVRAAILGPAAAGRQVLTGQGGDEVLGASRITQFAAHGQRRRRPSKASIRVMAEEVLPRRLRRMLVRRALQDRELVPWLLPHPREAVLAEHLTGLLHQPWDWREARWQHISSRMWVMGFESIAAVAAAEGFEQAHPLIDGAFVSALNAYVGRWGLPSRTAAMRLLAGDLLPEALLKRSTKATFENVYAGDGVREFARVWDGSGVDTELVDVEALRRAWSATRIHWTSLLPLQLAMRGALANGWVPREAGGDRS